MTGDAMLIGWQRERAAMEWRIRRNATDAAAIDRYNALSRLIAVRKRPAPILRLVK